MSLMSLAECRPEFRIDTRSQPTFMAAQSLFLWLESVFCGQNVNYFYSFTTMRHCNTYPIINVILHTCMYYNQFPEGEMLGLFQTALQQDSTSSSAAATFPSAYITQSQTNTVYYQALRRKHGISLRVNLRILFFKGCLLGCTRSQCQHVGSSIFTVV